MEEVGLPMPIMEEFQLTIKAIYVPHTQLVKLTSQGAMANRMTCQCMKAQGVELARALVGKEDVVEVLFGFSQVYWYYRKAPSLPRMECGLPMVNKEVEAQEVQSPFQLIDSKEWGYSQFKEATLQLGTQTPLEGLDQVAGLKFLDLVG